ncbi:site-specific DNA-methyltransferase [Terricaulis sp.]|uniref:site-specific DNA-methyltransferase n=1 Tax=Terricaulis sp. TaxID=2768686 RepID=UPI0037834E03
MSDRGGKYGGLSREQLVALLEKRDREKKLGLVWERDEIEADLAVDANFIAATLVPELCEKPAPWRNLVIEGDNYDALRWLRMTMAGRIKCIYVDPPYNTGNKDWVYNDRYFSADDRWRHSTWLEFLYRRFTLARDLLTEDGVILVSINDENRAKLELMLDEALPGMRIGSFTWRTRAGTTGESPFFSQDNEYVLVLANKGFDFGGQRSDAKKYKNPDNDPRGPWISVALQTNKDLIERPNSYFPVAHPTNGSLHPCNPNRVWSFQLRGMETARGDTYEDLLDAGLIIFSNEKDFLFHKSIDDLRLAIREKRSHPYLRLDLPDLERWVGVKIGLGTVRKKQFLSQLKRDTRSVSSWIDTRKYAKSDGDRIVLGSDMTAGGTSAIQELFGRKVFNYAKPPSLISSLVQQCTSGDDIILDFFSGSATTAQAVMELNAGDQGERRFIMVSSTERTADEADKNLCRDITAERIRRLNASKDGAYVDLAAEFAYLRCREIDFTDLDYRDGLAPGEAWNALEALHGLPLTPHDPEQKWQAHEGEDIVLVQVDKIAADLTPYLQGLAGRRANVFVYAWAPGQVREAVGAVDFEIHGVRDALVRRFQQ